jgi:hypothetical protein
MRTRATIVALALACAGCAIWASPAFAWYGRIQVEKVNVGGNANDTFAFHPAFSQTAASDFSLMGGQQSQAFDVLCNIDRPGHGTECTSENHNITLSVTEQPTSGYTLTDITCRYTQSNDDNGTYPAGQPTSSSPVKPASEVTTNLAGGTVTLKVHYDEWVLCTYTNTATPVPIPVPAPVSAPAAAPPPKIAVSPVRVQPGRASLAPSKCVTGNVVVARVGGRHIARVTFYVAGRKVLTLHHANRGGVWVLSKRIRGLAPHGPYRVRARVVFTASSQTKPKTLLMAVGRCSSAASAPKFTG